MKWLGGSLLAVSVALSAVFFAYEHQSLDWEGEILPMASQFSGNDGEKPLTQQIIVITGATNGIGLSLTRILTRLGAKVVALGRSPSKLKALMEELPSVRAVPANLENLTSVAEAAAKIRQEIDHIDILINNAGIHDGYDLETALEWRNFTSPDGFDRVFVVNYLSHVLLTEALWPLLQASSKPTILQISSSFHWAVDGSDLMPRDASTPPLAAQPGGGPGPNYFRGQRSYGNSKLAQLYHARSLAKQYPQAKIVSACPAWVATQIAGGPGSIQYWILRFLAFPVDGWGIVSALHAMFDEKGDYYTNTRFMDVAHWLVPSLPYGASRQGLVRHVIVNTFALAAMIAQKFAPVVQSTQSSPESYRDDIGNALHEWSLRTVAGYL